MATRNLFEPSLSEASGLAPVAPAKARRTDPVSSKIAARRITKSGKVSEDRKAVESIVHRDPWHTAGEFAAMLGEGWDNVRFSRRAPEIESIKKGPVRTCSKHGTAMCTWGPKS